MATGMGLRLQSALQSGPDDLSQSFCFTPDTRACLFSRSLLDA
jgi:hypothetical protein